MHFQFSSFSFLSFSCFVILVVMFFFVRICEAVGLEGSPTIRWTTLRAWVCATGDCSRLVEARSAACFFISVHVRWTQVCANGCNQEKCRATHSGLEPTRAPHMAAQGHRSTIANDHRARERQDASDVQTPSPMQSTTGCRAQPPRVPTPRLRGLDFAKPSTTGGRSATRGTCCRGTDTDKAAIEDSIDCNRFGAVASHAGSLPTKLATEGL